MDGLTRARALKREIQANASVLIPPTKKPHHRPEPNQPTETSTIVSLRQDQKLKWSEITHLLNRKRLEAGEPASLTPATVYSRFIQHTTRVAQPTRELGFEARDYMYLRHPNQLIEGGSGEVSVSKAGRKRIKDYSNARELKANVRQKVVGAEAQSELESVDRTDKLVEAVAKVERNFWEFVADEMERITGRLYEAEELARRYHGI